MFCAFFSSYCSTSTAKLLYSADRNSREAHVIYAEKFTPTWCVFGKVLDKQVVRLQLLVVVEQL